MAFGDIGAKVDALEFCTTDCTRPDIIMVTDGMFAITYTDASNHGIVATIGIDADGVIEPTIIDSLEFDASAGYHTSIKHVSGTIFAIAYRGVDSDGWVCTVDIAANGVIENAIVDSLEFDAGACYEPNLIHHTGTTFIVVYRNAANHGTLTTFAIDAAGNIGAAAIDTATFIASHGNQPKITNVLANIFAIVWRTGTYAAGMGTAEVAVDGTITTASIETLAFTTGFCSEPTICNPIGNIYAMAYRGVDDDGFVCTRSVTDAGDISDSQLDVLEFDTAMAQFPCIVAINAGMCAIAYTTTGSEGILATIQVDVVGEITDAVLDTYAYDVADSINQQIIIVAGDTFVIAYTGSGNDGFLCTPTIERPSLGRTRHILVLGIG